METKSGSVPALHLSAAPISRLPDELITEIVKSAHADILNGHPKNYLRDWIPLLHVCSHWRTILLSLKRLWRVLTITFGTKPDQLAFFLSLSGSLPLHIRFYDARKDVITDLVRLLGPRISTIQRISLSIRYLDSENPSDAFGDIFSCDMPMLEELVVGTRVLSNQNTGRILIDPQQFPRLQRLELVGINCPPNITRLRVLHLVTCTSTLSLDVFILLLSRCSQLEELRLDFSLCTYASDVIASNIPRARVERLRNLAIKDYCHAPTSALLAHLEAPSLTSLRVVCGRLPSSGSELLFRAFLPDHLSPVLSKLNGVPVSATLTFSQTNGAGGCDLELSETYAPQGRDPVVVNLFAAFTPSWTGAALAALQDILHLCANMRITELGIRADAFNLPPAVWQEVFSRLPHLQSFEAAARGQLWWAVWEGFRCASAGGAERICCPRLAKMRISHSARSESDDASNSLWDGGNIQTIKAALRAREEAGAKLQELDWVMFSPQDEASSHMAEDMFLPQIRPHVERLVYADILYDNDETFVEGEFGDEDEMTSWLQPVFP